MVAAHYSNGVLLLSDQTCFLSYFPSFPQVVAAHYSNGVLLLAEAAAGESRTRLFMLSRCGDRCWFIQAAGCALLANVWRARQGSHSELCVRARMRAYMPPSALNRNRAFLLSYRKRCLL